MKSFRKAFNGKHAALMQSMRVKCRFLNILKDKGLLTGDDVEEIRACSTEGDRVDKLLCILERSDNALFKDFIDALVEDGQKHVVRDYFPNRKLGSKFPYCRPRQTDDIVVPNIARIFTVNMMSFLLETCDILSLCFLDNSHCGEVLSQQKQEVLATIGRLQTQDISTGHQTDNEERQGILAKLYSSLSQQLNVHPVADAMFRAEGLTREQYNSIKGRTQRQAPAETLLNILLKDSHCTKFDCFLQALIDTDQKQIYVDIVLEALASGCNIGARHRRQIEEFRVELVNSVNTRYSSLTDLLYDSESWLSHKEQEDLTTIIEHWNSARDVLIASLQPANTTNCQPTRSTHNWVYSILGHLLRA